MVTRRVGVGRLRRATAAALMGASLAVLGAGTVPPAYAQSAAVNLSIPAGPLESALLSLGRQAGLHLVYPTELARGRVTSGVSGTVSANDALAQLLAGTGLSYQFTGANTVRISAPASGRDEVAADGSVILDTIDVSGRAGVSQADAPYETPGSVFHIGSENLERYRGTSPSDLVKGAPGVLSGDSRANGGIDVNIRGMQGQGRVQVTVDGAQNSTALYRGYQGLSSSTFLDPDFIAGVTVNKGPSTGASGVGAIGGSVAMRTLSASDIVPEGETFGARIKVEGRGNTTSPFSEPHKWASGAQTGSDYTYAVPQYPLSRPGILELGSGSASVAVAARSENLDLLAAFAHRKYGNYHAGTTGDGAPVPVSCTVAGGSCALDWYRRGLTAYLPGEEVLNTSQDTYSALVKGTLRFGDDHKLDLGFSRYDSIYGETFASGMWNNEQAHDQKKPLSHVIVDGYTARYNWNSESDLFDLKANLWLTNLDETSRSGLSMSNKWGRMYGGDIANTSRFDTALGALSLNYGLSYMSEATGPDRSQYVEIPPREGTRTEASAFADAKWSPFGWLDVDGGLRWHGYRTEDTRPAGTVWPVPTKTVFSGDAVDYSVGVTVKPLDGLQIFGTYKEASRLPSLFETVGGFMTTLDPNLRPERAKTWEVGANYTRDGIFTDSDSLRFKVSYFDNTVDDYTNRRWINWQMYMSNIARAHFSGLDLSARYEVNGFSAELAGSYYTDVQFCRTLANCKNSSLGADYAGNQIPPKYAASLTLSQRLLEDRLTLSARVSHTGPRSAGAEYAGSGSNPFVAAIPWKPYTLVDLALSYKATDALTLSLGVENLMDVYYVEPLSIALMPSPGRTIRLGLTADLNGQTLSSPAWADGSASYDWSGFHAGIHGGIGIAGVSGSNFRLPIWGSTVEPYVLPDINGTSFGVQAGYSHQFGNNLVLGLEGEFSSLGYKGTAATDTYRSGAITTAINWMGSARLRTGFAIDRWQVYGLAGYTFADVEGGYAHGGSHTVTGRRVIGGWTAGGGVEYALTENLSLKGEYTFTQLNDDTLKMENLNWQGTNYGTPNWTPMPKLDQVKLGLNYRF